MGICCMRCDVQGTGASSHQQGQALAFVPGKHCLQCTELQQGATAGTLCIMSQMAVRGWCSVAMTVWPSAARHDMWSMMFSAANESRPAHTCWGCESQQA